MLAALLMLAGILAGCVSNEQAQADEAMGRANAAMEEWMSADERFSTLVDEFANSDASTPEGIEAALSVVDQMEAALDESTAALTNANEEMATILDMDVDDEYKSYVQMLIDSNVTDLASDDKGRELVDVVRQMFTEVGKQAPDTALLDELNARTNEVAAEMDELDAEAREQSKAAEDYFNEQGFVDSATLE